MKNRILALACALAAAVPAAAIPDVVTYAARVENDAGPFDGTAAVTFELFGDRAGGTALWTEAAPSVVVVDGDLVHDLGSVEPLDDALLDRDALFLEVTFNGTTLTPRVAVNAAPFALRAREAGLAEVAVDAEQLGGRAAATYQFTAAAGGGLALSGTSFAVAAGGVTAAHIAANAVGTAALVDGAVLTADLADGAVSAPKLGPNAVTAPALAAGAVTATALAANAVTSSSIAASAVVAGKLGGSAVLEANIAAGAVTAAKIPANTIDASKLTGGVRQVAERPAGCGGGLQPFNQTVTSGNRLAGCIGGVSLGGPTVCSSTFPCQCASCETQACGFNGQLLFFDCGGALCNRTSAATCTTTTFANTNAGFLVFTP